MHGIIMGLPMPFPLANPNACSNGLTCPLEKNKKTHYIAKLPVLKSYPKVNFYWYDSNELLKMSDDNNKK